MYIYLFIYLYTQTYTHKHTQSQTHSFTINVLGPLNVKIKKSFDICRCLWNCFNNYMPSSYHSYLLLLLRY